MSKINRFWYTTNFPGIYPAGAAAVVVAKDRTEAFMKLSAAIDNYSKARIGPLESERDVEEVTLEQGAIVILDGDY